MSKCMPTSQGRRFSMVVKNACLLQHTMGSFFCTKKATAYRAVAFIFII